MTEIKEKSIDGNQYFLFEDDFIMDNVRCIPMVVRFKLDQVGIKLKLSEWSRFSEAERSFLVWVPCTTLKQRRYYRLYLVQLIQERTGNLATKLEISREPAWARLDKIEPELLSKAREHDWFITVPQWRGLSNLQRFALLKLYRPGHESKNFRKAMIEFGLAS